MEEINFTQAPKLNYEELKRGFLNNEISPEEFRDKLLTADQRNPTHDAAYENLDLLEDVEIKNYVLSLPVEVQEAYSKFLGFTEWHVAQDLIFKNEINKGLEYLKSSLKNSEAGNAESEWILYEKGTIAYLENDKELLKDIISEMLEDQKNTVILKNMLKGLEERGHPDYRIDY